MNLVHVPSGRRSGDGLPEPRADGSLLERVGIWRWTADPLTRKIESCGDLSELLGRNFDNLDDLFSALHPDDARLLNERLSTPNERGTVQEIDCRARGTTREWVHLHLVFRVDSDGNGRVLAHGLLRDDSALVEAREAAELGKLLAARAEKLSGVGYWWVPAGTDRFIWSDEMYRIYGLDPAAGPPDLESVVDYCHPDDREALRQQRELYHDKEAPEITVRIVRPDGEVRHVTARNMIEWTPSGEIAGRFGTLMDITEIKRAEAALKESEQRYRFLAEHAPDMITRTALTGEIIYVSPSSVRVFGYTPEEMKRLSARDMVHPDDYERVMGQIFKLIREQASRLSEPLVYRAKHKDGRWIWIEANPSQVFNERGEAIEFIDIVRDVTQSKMFEADLEKAKQRAEAAAAAKTAFLANMSHELRTPLTSIVGFSGMLGERSDLPADARHYAHRVTQASQALLAVINDVLDFSKLDAGQMQLEMQPISIRRVVEEAVGLIAMQTSTKSLEIRVECEPQIPDVIQGDSARLRQVLLNLLSNAVKFTNAGTITVRTAYRTDAETARLKISVVDTGPGIPPEALEHLFGRFTQADVSINRTHGGTGLGLAISKSIVELMGGRIDVETEVGKGSTFSIEIPAHATLEAVPAHVDDQAAVEGQPLCVLVVDDTAVNRELIKIMLEPMAMKVVEAPGGAQGVAAAVLERFDVILMDLRMPQMDGYEATRRIRAESALNRTTPVLALTADIERKSAEACYAAGMNDVLTKPIVRSQLVEKIIEWAGTNKDGAANGKRSVTG